MVMAMVPVCVVIMLAIAAVDGIEVKAPRNRWSSERKQTDWNELGKRELNRALQRKPNTNVAKNVILFLGDGMGPATVTAARFYLAQSRGKRIEDTALAWEHFPDVALSKTYNVDRMVADSAGTGTAYLSGVKTRYGVIGVNENVRKGDCSNMPGNAVDSVLTESKKEKWTGVVSTMRVTHATPAAAYAHTPDRNWESEVPDNVIDRQHCSDIATQLIDDHADIRVILGGGRQMFRPTNVGGRRKDNRNLIEEWKTKKSESTLPKDEYAYVETKDEFAAVNTHKVKYLLGLFNDNNMAYESDRVAVQPPTEPSLSEMTEKAILLLQHSPNGYFLLVEGGLIDYCHHNNRAFCAVNETVAMSDAVRVADDLTSDQDTLIIVTADHSHVMTMGGYPTIRNDITGLTDGDIPEDGKPMLTLTYADGPGYKVHRMQNGADTPRLNLTNFHRDKNFVNDAAVYRKYESHGGEDVAIYSRGPMSHLFHGVHEQNYIAHVMRYASCVGDNRGHCATFSQSPGNNEGAGMKSLNRKYTWIIAMVGLLLTRLVTFV